MTNETIRVSASYTIVIDNPFSAIYKTISFDIDKKKAIHTGYITPHYTSPNRIPYAFGRLVPSKIEIGVYREPVEGCFHHEISEAEAAELVSKEMARYDGVLAESVKIYRENRLKAGLPANQFDSTFVQSLILNQETKTALDPIVGTAARKIFAYECPRCKARGKTWQGSDPRCAFDADGEFLPDNWNCATMSALRSVPRIESYCQDHTLGVIALPEFEDPEMIEEIEDPRPNFLVLHWYKRRGATPLAQVVYMGHVIEPLTLELAERILTNLAKANQIETE